MTSEAVALSRVICDIYDAAIDPALWQKALHSACDFVGCHQANLFWQDTSAANVVTLHQYNDDPHFTRLYHETYAPLNPVFPAAIFQDVGSVVAATDLVPRAELENTRFFKEWIAPQNLGDSLGIVLEKDAHRAAFLALQGAFEFIDDASRQRAAMLVPHFQRAVTIGRLFSQSTATTTALAQTLDHVEAGVFLLAERGRITFSNVMAQRMVEEGSILRNARGALSAADPDADRTLKANLRAIDEAKSAVVGPATQLLLSHAGEVRWLATILPLIDGSRRRTGAAFEATAAVFVRSSQMASPVPLETLAKHYGLTAGEIRVAEAILRVTGLHAIAEMLGISRSTVKTHLNHILRKCGVSNQRDLIKLFAGMKVAG